MCSFFIWTSFWHIYTYGANRHFRLTLCVIIKGLAQGCWAACGMFEFKWASLLMHTEIGTWFLALTNSSHTHVGRSWQLGSRTQTERGRGRHPTPSYIVMLFLRFKQTLFAYQLWAPLPALRWTLRACSAWGSPLKPLTAPRWARTLSRRGITARWVRTSWWSCRRGPLR